MHTHAHKLIPIPHHRRYRPPLLSPTTTATTIFVCKVPEDLATASHKVAVVLGVDNHVILHNVILVKYS